MTTTGTCVNCQRALAPDDTHGLCGGCLAAGLAGALAGEDPAPARTGLAGRELLEELSRGGGMGIVYRARQRGLNRLVALKLVHATAGGADASAGRLRKEAELAATLEHPNIVPVYDVGEVDGRPWSTMKLAEGGSLAEQLEEFRLPAGATGAEAEARLRRLAELFAAIARGVHHAHQRGILHRDLKPSNLLLDADFGIAVRSDVDATLTVAGARWARRPTSRPKWPATVPGRPRWRRTSTGWARCCSTCSPAERRMSARPPSRCSRRFRRWRSRHRPR